MKLIAGLFVFFACVTLNVAQAKDAQARSGDKPGRVVSLDFCADQYVLALADRSQIAALSSKATDSFSYMAKTAIGVPKVRDTAEDVITLKPDLVVRSFGGGFGVSSFFARTKTPVAQLSFSETLDGVRENIRTVASALGQPARGEALIATFNARLAASARPASGLTVLYVTPGGVTTGKGSLIHEVVSLVGLRNYHGDYTGWQSLPLEKIAVSPPDMLITAFYDTESRRGAAWSPSRHPVARQLLKAGEPVHVSGASTARAGWFIADAAEALAARRDALVRAGH